MKYLMDEKGNKYIPESDVIAIETIRDVLQSNKYITDFVVDDIINTFQSRSKTETKNSEKSVKKNPKILSRDNIKYIDSLGYLHYKRSKVPKSKWNLEQVISIQTKLNHNYEKVPNGQRQKICNDMGLDLISFKTILRNLKDGPLEEIVEDWKMENNYGIKRQTTPVVNNPEKRKEMGFGGIP